MSYGFGVLVDKVVNRIRISLILIGMRIPYRKRFGTILNSGSFRTVSIVFVYELVFIKKFNLKSDLFRDDSVCLSDFYRITLRKYPV